MIGCSEAVIGSGYMSLADWCQRTLGECRLSLTRLTKTYEDGINLRRFMSPYIRALWPATSILPLVLAAGVLLWGGRCLLSAQASEPPPAPTPDFSFRKGDSPASKLYLYWAEPTSPARRRIAHHRLRCSIQGADDA